MTNGWKMRVCIVLSAIWALLAFAVTSREEISTQLAVVFLPLIIVWGFAWSISAFIEQRRATRAVGGNSVEADPSRKEAIFAGFTYAGIVVGGMIAIVLYLGAATKSDMSANVGHWFGEWLVYSLFGFLGIRLIKGITKVQVAVAMALLLVLGMSWRAYDYVSEEKNAKEMLSRAMPLISKMMSGQSVSEQEIKDAKTARFEGVLLAHRQFYADLNEISKAYESALLKNNPISMLSPSALATKQGRSEARRAVSEIERQIADRNRKFDAASAKWQALVESAIQVDRTSFGIGVREGMIESATASKKQLYSSGEASLKLLQTVNGLLDFLDYNQNDFVGSNTTPPKLLFRNDALLAKYNFHVDNIESAAIQEGKTIASMEKSIDKFYERATDMLKK